MPDGPATTETTLFNGRLRLRQPARGHRAGTDAVLLAAAAAPQPGQSLIDVGSGVGTVGLALALRRPDLRVRLLERDPRTAALARDNVALNDCLGRVTVHEDDLFDTAAVERADWVVTNPPFYADGTIRTSPDPGKAGAYAFGAGDLARWMAACCRLVRPKGRVLVIHRPDALPDLLAATQGRLGDVRIRAIHAWEDRPAIRLIFGGSAGHRGGLTILPPLTLHQEGGGFSPVAEALSKGETILPLWPPEDALKRRKPAQGPASD